MAHTAHHSTFGVSVLHLLTAPFVALGKGLVAIGEANSRQKSITFLNTLSDEELAQRGIKREDIAMHVFRDYAGF